MVKQHKPVRMQRAFLHDRSAGKPRGGERVAIDYIACPMCQVPVPFAVGPRGFNFPFCSGAGPMP